MQNKSGRLGTFVAWGTFLVLFGLLAIGAIIAMSRLAGYLWNLIR